MTGIIITNYYFHIFKIIFIYFTKKKKKIYNFGLGFAKKIFYNPIPNRFKNMLSNYLLLLLL